MKSTFSEDNSNKGNLNLNTKGKDSLGNKILSIKQECSKLKDCQELSENNKPTGKEPFFSLKKRKELNSSKLQEESNYKLKWSCKINLQEKISESSKNNWNNKNFKLNSKILMSKSGQFTTKDKIEEEVNSLNSKNSIRKYSKSNKKWEPQKSDKLLLKTVLTIFLKLLFQAPDEIIKFQAKILISFLSFLV